MCVLHSNFNRVVPKGYSFGLISYHTVFSVENSKMSGLRANNLEKVSVQFSYSVMSDSLRSHGCQASMSITNSWSLLKLVSIASVSPSNHLILCHPLFHPLDFSPASASFPVSQFVASGGQSIGVSASE